MGLDVGVVNIKYLERPDQPIYDFLGQLAEYDPENWGEVWEGNSIMETTRRWMLAKAREYIENNSLTRDEATTIISWINSLPWQGDTIMLHLGW